MKLNVRQRDLKLSAFILMVSLCIVNAAVSTDSDSEISLPIANDVDQTIHSFSDDAQAIPRDYEDVP